MTEGRISARSAMTALVAVMIMGHGVATQQARPTRLLQAADLVHLGSFTIPDMQDVETHWTGSRLPCEYTHAVIGFNPSRNSLFLVCHAWSQSVAEIEIPELGGEARVLQQPRQVADLNLINPDSPNEKQIGGLYVSGDRLVVSVFDMYDGEGSARASHFVRSTTLGSPAQGPVRVGRVGFTAGYMAGVPESWRGLLGGDLLTGACCLSVIGRTSLGPAVSSVSLPALLAAPSQVSSNQLVGYPEDHPELGDLTPTTEYYGASTSVRGVAFLPGTASVLFLGPHGSGPYCYGGGTSDPTPPEGQCHDPEKSDQGTHNYPYSARVWAYDANDLARVRGGQRDPWQLRPYAMWTLPGFEDYRVGGATVDPASGRLFVSEQYGDGIKPRIHVYSIGAGGPPGGDREAVVSCQGAWEQTGTTAGRCADGQQTGSHQWTFRVAVPAANGGMQCAAANGATLQTPFERACAVGGRTASGEIVGRAKPRGGSTAASLAAAGPAQGAPVTDAGRHSESVPGEVLVRFRHGTSEAAKDYRLSRVGLRRVSEVTANYTYARSVIGADLGAAIEGLSNAPEVEFVQRNGIHRLPEYVQRQTTVAGLAGLVWPALKPPVRDASAAYDSVAIIGTGLTIDPGDLSVRFWTETGFERAVVPVARASSVDPQALLPARDFTYSTGPPVVDLDGQGTALATALLESDRATVGDRPLRVMPLKACVGAWDVLLVRGERGVSGYPSTSGIACTDSSLMAAIQHATVSGVDLVLLEVGGEPLRTVLVDTIESALSHGVSVVMLMPDGPRLSGFTELARSAAIVRPRRLSMRFTALDPEMTGGARLYLPRFDRYSRNAERFAPLASLAAASVDYALRLRSSARRGS